jgi:hypothetical protein
LPPRSTRRAIKSSRPPPLMRAWRARATQWHRPCAIRGKLPCLAQSVLSSAASISWASRDALSPSYSTLVSGCRRGGSDLEVAVMTRDVRLICTSSGDPFNARPFWNFPRKGLRLRIFPAGVLTNGDGSTGAVLRVGREFLCELGAIMVEGDSIVDVGSIARGRDAKAPCIRRRVPRRRCGRATT